MFDRSVVDDWANSYKKTKKTEKHLVRISSLRPTLSRLKKKGLVENKNSSWLISMAGIKYLEKVKHQSVKGYPKASTTGKKVLVFFDVPEPKKADRNWLRKALIGLDFKLIQKSVWLGPAPLPSEFIKDLKFKDLLRCIHFFEVTKKDII